MPYNSKGRYVDEAPDLSYLDAVNQGMPAPMAAAARTNLAQEDATIANVNAAGRVATSPVGAPVAPVAAAPEEMPVSAANPTIDALESRRQALADGLSRGIDPDAPAKYVHPERRKEIARELYQVTGIVHQNTLEEANFAKENYKQMRDIESAREFTGFVSALRGITEKNGTPEYANKLLGIVGQFPNGAQTPAARELLTMHAKNHDTAAVIPTLQPGYQAVPSNVNAKGEVSYDVKPVGEESKKAGEEAKKSAIDELKSIHKTTPTELLNATSIEYGEVDEKGRFKPDKGGKTGGKIARINIGHGEPVTMTAGAYATYKGMFGGKGETAEPAKDEKVIVVKDGKQFRLPKSQLDAALKAGYSAK